MTKDVALLLARNFQWDRWEGLIERNGITVDRPLGSRHPVWTEIQYPIDYGYVNGTVNLDQEEVDVFVGKADVGLVALLVTTDYRKGDTEFKLLYRCSWPEVYLVNGFINFDRTLMEGTLVMRPQP